MKILGSNSWQGFTRTTSGDGVITVTDKVARVSTGLNSGVAQLEKKFHVQPNEIITLRALARLVSGDRARMAISYPTAQSPKNTAEYITSPYWQHYSITLNVPPTHNLAAGNPDFANLILGGFYEDNGVAEFTDVQVESSGQTLPVPRVIAAAKIKMANGVATINPNYANHGITSLTYAPATNNGLLVVQTDFTCKSNLGFMPLPFVTHDGQLARQVSLGAAMDNSGLGRVNVVFGNPSTGALIDMQTIASLEFNLMVIA